MRAPARALRAFASRLVSMFSTLSLETTGIERALVNLASPVLPFSDRSAAWTQCIV